MKKILLFAILIAPITANAFVPTVEQDPTPNPTPTQLTITDDDRVQVVTASYVKGAYNETLNVIESKKVNALTTWESSFVSQLDLADGSVNPNAGGGSIN